MISELQDLGGRAGSEHVRQLQHHHVEPTVGDGECSQADVGERIGDIADERLEQLKEGLYQVFDDVAVYQGLLTADQVGQRLGSEQGDEEHDSRRIQPGGHWPA